MNNAPFPLCLGIDGTLTLARTSDELLLLAAKRSPAALWNSLVSSADPGEPPAAHLDKDTT